MRFFKYILTLSLFAATSFADTNVNTKTLQETLDNIDNWLGALSSAAGDTNVSFYLPGTNIVGATYDETNETWTVDSQVSGYLPGTNILGYTYSVSNNVWVYDQTVALEPVLLSLTTARSSGSAGVFYPITSWSSVSGPTNVFILTNGLLKTAYSGNYAVGLEMSSAAHPGAIHNVNAYYFTSGSTNRRYITRARSNNVGGDSFLYSDHKSFSVRSLPVDATIEVSHSSQQPNFSSSNQVYQVSATVVYLGPTYNPSQPTTPTESP